MVPRKRPLKGQESEPEMHEAWRQVAVLLIIVVLASVPASRLLNTFGPIRKLESLTSFEDLLVIDTFMYTLPGFATRGLYAFDVDRGTLYRWVRLDPEATAPIWFPPLPRLLFGITAADSTEAYTITLDGQIEEAQIVQYYGSELETSGFTFGRTVSRDGSKIALVHTPDSIRYDIYVRQINGSDLRRVTHDTAFKGPPSWSPDGAELVFSAESEDLGDLYRINAEGSKRTLLTGKLEGNSYLPQWSPDGRYIAFIHETSDQPGTLWLMRPDGSEIREVLPPHPSGDPRRGIRDFAWSPDGTRIAFTSGQDGYCGVLATSGSSSSCTESIYVVDVDGADVVQLTDRWQNLTRLFWLTQN